MLWRKPTRPGNPLPDLFDIRIEEVSTAVMNISNFWKTILSAAAWAEKHSVWIMPAQRPSFIPWKLSGFTESLCSPNTSRRSQSSNTLPCSTTAKGFIRHSAICPRVSSKPITIFQGSICPPKLDQIIISALFSNPPICYDKYKFNLPFISLRKVRICLCQLRASFLF